MLTDTSIRAVKPSAKPQKLFDGQGLFLLVNPNGGRLWRLKYRIHGKERLAALGKYPDISLKAARERRDDIRRQLANSIDPSVARQSARTANGDTFEVIAREFLKLQLGEHERNAPLSATSTQQTPTITKRDRKSNRGHGKRVTEHTVDTALRRLETYVFPHIGARPIRSLSAPELLTVLRRIEARGTFEITHRIRGLCGRVFRYAIATGRADRDIAADLIGALTPVAPQNFASITEPLKVAELLRAIDGYQGEPTTAVALKLAPQFFVRPSELRKAEWTEFNLDSEPPEWRIPAVRMKLREPHIVPLPRQSVALLCQLREITGTRRFVFSSLRTRDRPMSENCISAALRRMGYTGDEMTWHGFRSLASTLLNEQGWNSDWIETQLAHGERNRVRGAYNWAKYLAQRRIMMQAWADYLDELRTVKQRTAAEIAAARSAENAVITLALPEPHRGRLPKNK